MLKAETIARPTDKNLTGTSDLYAKNGLEDELDNYKEGAIARIKFSVIVKPAIISFVALILSFFLDLSYVPILGNVSIKSWKGTIPNLAAGPGNSRTIQFLVASDSYIRIVYVPCFPGI